MQVPVKMGCLFVWIVKRIQWSVGLKKMDHPRRTDFTVRVLISRYINLGMLAPRQEKELNWRT